MNEWMKTSVYVIILASANIKGGNISRSRQLSFLALAKKFHPTALFESAIPATSYNIVLFETAEPIFANEWPYDL